MTAYEFFLKHAGFSYNPATETRQQAKRRCAKEMAAAERKGRDIGLRFLWMPDWDEPGSEVCEAYLESELKACLCGIEGATPEYRRVIEAELAMEAQK